MYMAKPDLLVSALVLITDQQWFVIASDLIYVCSLFVFAWPSGNPQNIQTETRGAHQPSDDVQQCHQQTEKMP